MKKLLFNPATQILLAIVLGAWFGMEFPDHAALLRPVSEGFVALLRWLMMPLMFGAVAHGIASLRNLANPGRAGFKALLCFEVLSTLALSTGILVASVLRPGDSMVLAGAAPTASGPLQAVGAPTFSIFLLALGLGATLIATGEPGRRLTGWLGAFVGRSFSVVRWIVALAPLIAFASIANSVGRHGIDALLGALDLLLAIYLGTALFIVLALGALARLVGFGVWRFIRAIGEEILVAVGTASSLAAMPRLIAKLDEAGCAPEATRVLVPAGYAFNLSGSAVYLGVALVFLAQASGAPLSPAGCAAMFAIALLCSKTATPMNGSAFMTVASAVAMLPAISAEGLVLLFSVERLMKCRPIGNLVSVGVSCMAICAWTGKLDRQRMRQLLGS